MSINSSLDDQELKRSERASSIREWRSQTGSLATDTWETHRHLHITRCHEVPVWGRSSTLTEELH